MHVMFQIPKAGNAEAPRSQRSDTNIPSALSASLHLKVLPSAKQEQAIKANLRGLGHGR
jgi:hypothetical protein